MRHSSPSPWGLRLPGESRPGGGTDRGREDPGDRRGTFITGGPDGGDDGLSRDAYRPRVVEGWTYVPGRWDGAAASDLRTGPPRRTPEGTIGRPVEDRRGIPRVWGGAEDEGDGEGRATGRGPGRGFTDRVGTRRDRGGSGGYGDPGETTSDRVGVSEVWVGPRDGYHGSST